MLAKFGRFKYFGIVSDCIVAGWPLKILSVPATGFSLQQLVQMVTSTLLSPCKVQSAIQCRAQETMRQEMQEWVSASGTRLS